MRRYPYLVGDKASNKPDASTAYNIAATALDGARTFAAALSAGDIADGDAMAVRAYKYDANGNPTGAWEICWCTFTDSSPDTLTRGALVSSSTGSKIDWSTATGEDFAPALEVVNPTDAQDGEIVDAIEIQGGTEAYAQFDPGLFESGWNYTIELDGVRRVGGYANVQAQFYSETTAAWLSTAAAYIGQGWDGNGGYMQDFNPGGTAINLASNVEIAGATYTSDNYRIGTSGFFHIRDPRSADRVQADWLIYYWKTYTGDARPSVAHIVTAAAHEVSAVRFLMSAGYIEGRFICRRRRGIPV